MPVITVMAADHRENTELFNLEETEDCCERYWITP